MFVRVVLADPQPLFAHCVSWVLTQHPEIEVAGWTTDELEALEMIERLRPNVILSEIELARGSGFGIARRASTEVDVVILTRRSPRLMLMDAVSAGARGWLRHDLDPRVLASLLANRTPGEFMVDPAKLLVTLKELAAASSERGKEGSLSELTSREREVLLLVARGLDNEAIAATLHLSKHTVRTHVGTILRKLGVHNRADAARLALEAGEAETGTAVLKLQGPTLQKS